MAILINDSTYKITRVVIADGLRGRVFLTRFDDEVEVGRPEEFEMQWVGDSNFVRDAYDLLITLPEFSAGVLDNVDIAIEFPGSGMPTIVVNGLTLEEAKAQAKYRITQARNAEELQGFSAYGKTFDSDLKSIQRILVAANTAQVVGEAFSIDWTCMDNSVITLSYEQMVGMPVIMAQAANAMHIKARDLKAQIDAATTLEEINAVVW